MDLREKKTIRNIKNAFLKLRAHKPLEKITVKELAEAAEISKATFYLHFKDIYDLSDQLGEEIIQTILNGIADPSQILENPAAFTKDLFLSFFAQKNLIDIVFSGAQSYILPNKIEAALREYVFQLCPELADNASFNILLTYQIQGSFFAYSENSSRFDTDTVIEAICCFTDVIGKSSLL